MWADRGVHAVVAVVGLANRQHQKDQPGEPDLTETCRVGEVARGQPSDPAGRQRLAVVVVAVAAEAEEGLLAYPEER